MTSKAAPKITQGWLVKDAKVLASLEVHHNRRARAKGLLGRDSFEGAVMLMDTKSVHTVAMKFDIDVAFLDQDNRVLKIVHMQPHRVSAYVMKAKSVIEAEAGAFARWGITVGDELEIRE